MNGRIAVCVTGPDRSSAGDQIDQGGRDSRVYALELRADMIKDARPSELIPRINRLGKKAIWTPRNFRESGVPEGVNTRGGWDLGDEERRIDSYEAAVNAGASYIDIELMDYDSLERRNWFRKAMKRTPEEGRGFKVIGSYHNFKGGNTSDYLVGLFAAYYSKVDICKAATVAKDEDDDMEMLKFVVDMRKNGRDCIGLSMGQLGAKTRVLETMKGGYLTFACIPGAKAAPGQYTVDELGEAWKLMSGEKT